MATVDDETLRTTALAFWRYAHDYLRTARTLCMQHRLLCSEAQVSYHLAAQALEFALKAFLRAAGIAADVLRNEVRHSLPRALAHAEAAGLPSLPVNAQRAIARIAPHHQDEAFVHVKPTHDGYPDLEPLFSAAHALLHATAPAVARDYSTRFARGGSPSADELVQRLRADLEATAGEGLAFA